MITPGRRIYPDVDGRMNFQPGDYGFDKDGLLLLRPPRGEVGALDGDEVLVHEVLVHEDLTITVSPSILSPEWHGYLERGIWRDC